MHDDAARAAEEEFQRALGLDVRRLGEGLQPREVEQLLEFALDARGAPKVVAHGQRIPWIVGAARLCEAFLERTATYDDTSWAALSERLSGVAKMRDVKAQAEGSRLWFPFAATWREQEAVAEKLRSAFEGFQILAFERIDSAHELWDPAVGADAAHEIVSGRRDELRFLFAADVLKLDALKSPPRSTPARPGCPPGSGKFQLQDALVADEAEELIIKGRFSSKKAAVQFVLERKNLGREAKDVSRITMKMPKTEEIKSKKM